jgi:predicted transposase YbfD/YdcC
LLSLEGCTVTLDALHAQRQTAQTLRDQGADYVLALKGNQGTLCEEVRTLLHDPSLAGQQAKETDAVMAALKHVKRAW